MRVVLVLGLLISLVPLGWSQAAIGNGLAGLVIGNDQVGRVVAGMRETLARPGILVAWRNSRKVLEIEVRVQNHSDQTARGQLYVDLVDHSARVLARWPNPGQEVPLVVPARLQGGGEGKRFQIIGSRDLNLLIDRLDRANRPYSMRATILSANSAGPTLGQMAAKTYNVPMAVQPAAVHFYEYWLRNDSRAPMSLKMLIDSSRLPSDWELTAAPANGQILTLGPGQTTQGTAIVRTPVNTRVGAHVDLRFTAANVKNGTIADSREWFLMYDTTVPRILEQRLVVDPKTGMVNIFVKAVDELSGIREASGVTLAFSTDGGLTWADEVISYLEGNFLLPTSFASAIGPFRSGTRVTAALAVSDNAGNIVRTGPMVINIP